MTELSMAAQAALAQVSASFGSELERRQLAAKALREQAVRFASNDLLYAAVIHVAAELEGQ